ncbi:hypothetical protein [Leptolyngbya ohadii]|uniref:hypothetical protein n=1 Tax=Leptolyngbya ohadii TaxID=1962290 RepID=UPI000B59F218|nr:hypothetical protein [Leptolyngbya ohadii]
MNALTFNAPTLSDEQLIAICEYAEVISCKCPAYLAGLLQQVKDFRSYTTDCANFSPEDAATHAWLGDRASQMEAFLIQTIFELMEREGLLDEAGQPDFSRLAQASRSGALQQMGIYCANSALVGA